MKIFKLLVLLGFTQLGFTQVGIGTTTPDPSSILHLNSTTSGLLVPRLTSVQKNAVASPATGLLIYQIDGAAGFWYFNGSVWVPFGGGATYTFDNGLTLTGSNAQLGGKLIKTTTLDLDLYDLTIRTNSPSSYPGEFVIQGKNRTISSTKFASDYIEFGNDFPFFDTTFDGSSFTDANGDSQTIDVIAGFQAPSAPSAGSCIKIGSIEYVYDDQNALAFRYASLIPHEDGSTSYSSIGSSAKRWNYIYAVNGTIQTSDITLKKNIKPVKYGLKEILAINPISYNWKNGDKIGKTTIPKDQQELKLGFSAQELLSVLPEVVQTHSWVPSDEKGNYRRVENDKLGVNYSELIPVLVNAIKEQQKEIEELKELVRKQN